MTSADSSGPVCVRQVLRVRHADSTRMVRPGDFDSRVVARHASLAELPERARYVPLYADWRAERLVHGRWEGDAALSDVPFLYQHQRRHVQWLAELPFERLDAWHDDAGLTPTFVFSIGRCGSTLLSRLLAAAGEPAISEPDVLTNVAWVDDDAELAVARRWGPSVVRAAVCGLALACGRAPVIKLRARCNRAVDVFLQAFPQARYVFMFRERDDWVRSTSRAFGERGETLAELLKVSVEAFDRLHRAGVRPQPVWYEDLLAGPLPALRRIVSDPAALAARGDAIATALSRDAQAGSGLSRERLSTRGADAEALAAFDACWRAIRSDALLSEHGLARLR
ncbi:sulfotransferase family protein [Burkholderia gladioli]|uniref:sulfotransferase family protein n=1 Tax=Burkholderia gladioli TaxID=28095 RepID=UPI00163E3225|nr:sulfotransferase family protein [Burkholderia gladioli]